MGSNRTPSTVHCPQRQLFWRSSSSFPSPEFLQRGRKISAQATSKDRPRARWSRKCKRRRQSFQAEEKLRVQPEKRFLAPHQWGEEKALCIEEIQPSLVCEPLMVSSSRVQPAAHTAPSALRRSALSGCQPDGYRRVPVIARFSTTHQGAPDFPDSTIVAHWLWRTANSTVRFVRASTCIVWRCR